MRCAPGTTPARRFVTRARWQGHTTRLACRGNGRDAAVTAATIPEERALRDPRGACVADEHTELDNAAFAQAVAGVAAVFAAAGLRRGGVLAIMLPNRVELVTGIFAAWRLGAAVTLVHPALAA